MPFSSLFSFYSKFFWSSLSRFVVLQNWTSLLSCNCIISLSSNSFWWISYSFVIFSSKFCVVFCLLLITNLSKFFGVSFETIFSYYPSLPKLWSPFPLWGLRQWPNWPNGRASPSWDKDFYYQATPQCGCLGHVFYL